MKEIDWEQRRYEIAKELFCYYPQSDITNVVRCADNLIKELKKKHDEAI